MINFIPIIFMGANINHRISFLSLIFLLLIFSNTLQRCFSQSTSPQNIEVFYPFPPPPTPPIVPPPPVNESPETTIPPPPAQEGSRSSKRSAVGRAIGITAASTLVLSGLLFFFFILAYSRRRNKEKENHSSVSAVVPHGDGGGSNLANGNFVRVEGNLKGVIVDENGLDVLYWRNLEEEDGDNRSSFKRRSYKNLRDEQREEEKRIVSGERRSFKSKSKSKPPVTEVPLLRGKSSTSQNPVWAEEKGDEIIQKAPSFSYGVSFSVEDKQLDNRNVAPLLPPVTGRRSETVEAAEGRVVDPTLPPSQQFGAASRGRIVNPQLPNEGPAAPPPPPPSQAFGTVSKGRIVDPQPTTAGPPLPPPPQQLGAVSKEKIVNPPPPPPPRSRASPPAPPPPSGSTSTQSSKPPAPPPSTRSSSLGEGTSSNEQVKLKPLHWDKVNANADHSMVWDKIDNGSFKFDGDLMEALFGYVATNRKSPKKDNRSPSPTDDQKSGPPSQIFILETRKSQNTAIVIKSLGLTREEILGALMDGRGLNADTIEKLTRISPTDEEKFQLLAFNGDPTRLADAESFLYHILKAVPSAFSRFHAMLFRSNYGTEVSNIRESLQTLESACKELRTRGLFLKLLEAVLKAGNRLNAGTSRGNAQAFNLTALRKLSDFKSTDGKTTLLQFVVQEVVRAEGKRCVLNRNHSLNRASSQGSDSDSQRSNNPSTNDDQEREYMRLGLPVIGGLSAEFLNVKKAAALDYDVVLKTSSALEQQVMEIRRIVSEGGDDSNGGGFADEMRGFLETAELEVQVLKEEQARVTELVKKTTDYYQAGTSKEKNTNLLQLFVIVRDFLGMVDQVCIDISRDVQQKRRSGSSVVGPSSSPGSPRIFRFPKLPPNFMSDSSTSDSSERNDDDKRSDESR